MLGPDVFWIRSPKILNIAIRKLLSPDILKATGNLDDNVMSKLFVSQAAENT